MTAIVERGMGQMEQKTFPVAFPADYKKDRGASSEAATICCNLREVSVLLRLLAVESVALCLHREPSQSTGLACSSYKPAASALIGKRSQ